MMEAADLSLAYRNGPVVLSLQELRVKRGEILTMIGPNGGGKTTLLRSLAGLMEPASGSVSLHGVPLYGRGALSRRRRAQEIAVVLTTSLAPGYLRARELVELGRVPYQRVFGPAPSTERSGGALNRTGAPNHAPALNQAPATVDRAMEATGVRRLAERQVTTLSDGERQRVLISRALAQEPRLLLLDEPAAHLDPPHQTRLFMLLRRLVAESMIEAAVVATHNVHLALHFSDRLLLVADAGACSGTPEELLENGSIERAFLGGEGPGDQPRLGLDRQRLWFLPIRDRAGEY